MKIKDLQLKKIAILGLSKEGISSAEYLFRHGIPFTILEKNIRSRSEILDKIRLWQCPTVFGSEHLQKLSSFNFILRSPGVPLFLPEIQEAKKNGTEISSQTKLFMALCPSKNIIGITGTKGKGTTSKLIEFVLKEDGKEVFLGGNIGEPPLNFLDRIDANSYVVLELSSFQLTDFEKSPHIAVILGLAPDHLAPESENAPNYHASFREYLEAKKNLVRFQKKNDYLIVKNEDENSRDFIKSSQATAYYYSTIGEVDRGGFVEEKHLKFKNHEILNIGSIDKIQLKGRHHLENVCAALTVCGLLDCATMSLQKGLFKFAGYEHRLEFVANKNEVSYYDDSAATNPEPAIAAIQAFSEPLIIILGGSDKGQSYEKLGEIVVNSSVKLAYLIGDMAEKIASAIFSAQNNSKVKRKFKVIKSGYPSMSKIMHDCQSFSQKGDVILLSPACASFDMFANYRDRGDQFKEEVRKI